MEAMQRIIAGYSVDYSISHSKRNVVRDYLDEIRSNKINRLKPEKEKKYKTKPLPTLDELLLKPLFKRTTRKIIENKSTNFLNSESLRDYLTFRLNKLPAKQLDHLKLLFITNDFNDLVYTLTTITNER
jgi:hypothetical protein